MKLLKQLLVLLAAIPALAGATSPVRYVQISTNSFAVQAGSVNVQGVTASSITLSGELKTLTPSTSGQFLTSAGPNLPSFFSFNGKILQVVSSQTTISKTSTSGTYADTALQTTIVPKSSSSIVGVFVTQYVNGGADSFITLRLIGNGSTLISDYPALDFTGTGGSITAAAVPLIYMDTPGVSGSAITYKTQFARGGGAGTVGVQSADNAISGISRIILIEIGQ